MSRKTYSLKVNKTKDSQIIFHSKSTSQIVIILLFLFFMLSAVFSCRGNMLSNSSIALQIYGGYSEVKSTLIAFECKKGKINYSLEVTYWKSGRQPVKEQGAVPESLYVRLWDHLTKLGVWQLKDVKYAGEDFETYKISVRLGNKAHSFSVQNPSEQKDLRGYEIGREVLRLYKILRKGD